MTETPRHDGPFEIIAPCATDAPEVSVLWCASIERLCVRDHQGRPDILRAWTENKTPEHLSAAFTDPTLTWRAARHGPSGAIAGVGLLGPEGIIRAVYVHPAFVGQGVGGLLLQILERAAIAAGHDAVTLESTETGHGFYQAHGYVQTGPAVGCFGVPARPMRKALSPTDPQSGRSAS
ncbi:GNAT family N-acetyltransferase [Roseospira visakhapatnamensis]|uniref:GNAT superfamily N-acetyltransferase n=1 Tax=Roseospira visakhapatnamensis TaxID=390880 RepID=A0A7W6W9S0_9PROT|nr:GNAT family N-acetyltransferase [Roseospira visakhapatnamensis]MBB4266420.1 GNAT superfamily N-acetyltransferase [Roseospira visakhapatnamensis]